MLRWIVLTLLTLVAAEPALAADQIAVHRKTVHARKLLPPGLPRAHYDYRTTIVHRTLPPVVAPEAEALISATVPTTPLLPGSSTLPGYYGRPFSYYYQGPYYGGPYEPYFFRLPYACGVYGYC